MTMEDASSLNPAERWAEAVWALSQAEHRLRAVSKVLEDACFGTTARLVLTWADQAAQELQRLTDGVVTA